MPKNRAVCVQCGNFKRHALSACDHCGFNPTSAAERAKSLILSEYFDFGEEVVGRSYPELEAASEKLKSGDFVFDTSEVVRVREAVKKAEAITPRMLAIDLIKWIGPPIAVLAIVFWLLSR